VYFVPRDFADPLSLIIRMSSLLPFNFYKIEHLIPLSFRKKCITFLFSYQVSPKYILCCKLQLLVQVLFDFDEDNDDEAKFLVVEVVNMICSRRHTKSIIILQATFGTHIKM